MSNPDPQLSDVEQLRLRICAALASGDREAAHDLACRLARLEERLDRIRAEHSEEYGRPAHWVRAVSGFEQLDDHNEF